MASFQNFNEMGEKSVKIAQSMCGGDSALRKGGDSILYYLLAWGGKYAAWQGLTRNLFGFSMGKPIDELYSSTKSSETGLT